MARPGPRAPEVHRITVARRPHSDDQNQRVGRYLLSMSVRTVCFALIFVVHGPARWVFVVGAVFLPYVAVIAANARGDRRPVPPSLVVPPGGRDPQRRQLEADGPPG
jgi:hypothetical protein